MNILEKIKKNVNLEEGTGVLEKILIKIRFFNNTATKLLARSCFLPVPVVAAVKNELIKAGLLKRDAKITVTPAGSRLIEEELGYRGLDQTLFQKLAADNYPHRQEPEISLRELAALMEQRPRVDVTLDQSKSTAETAINRSLLALRNNLLIGKKILCLGDDDLISVSTGLLLKQLFPQSPCPAALTVLDIDQRFLDYIEKIAGTYDLPIKCVQHDLRSPLPVTLQNKFHTIFTDPPYTLPGLELFLTRAAAALNWQQDPAVLLSFAHKSAAFTLKMHEKLLNMHLVPVQILPGFNKYEGAEIIGNISQLIILKPAGNRREGRPDFTGPLYTGEIRKTRRTYSCQNCKKSINVGQGEIYITIEQLKTARCPDCGAAMFTLREKKARNL